jgi:hypothetical protein
MRWAFDLDGVITANPEFFKWWIYHLRSKRNRHLVYIITARNPERLIETEAELKFWGIQYDELRFMEGDEPRTLEAQADWKVRMILDIMPQVWVDNDFKIYEQACNIRTDIQGVTKIEI